MNLSAIPSKSTLGKVIRYPFRLIPPSMKLPVLQGKLKGKKWIVGSMEIAVFIPKSKIIPKEVFCG